jgi:uncharacterized protein
VEKMSLKPWREIARPHKDVLEGTFKQSEFAADISAVASGTATEDYQDAEKFFSRTFITEGMKLLLISVAQRLTGNGGDPVIQLQTAFGGGKTHTMLAVLHLAARKVSTDKLQGITPILDEAGISDLPRAHTAVLDGINLSVSQGKQHGSICTNTLWGELAWQLLGDEGYSLVSACDRDGTSPGKDVLADLLKKAAPCIVLIDELQKFFSDLTPGKQLNAGTYEANLKFIQALTEAFKTVPNAILLASLPESEAEVGDAFGQKTLAALEKHFGRLESVWKPVAAEEAFEIVRRRLFEHAGDRPSIEGISRQFCDYYRTHSDKFPLETQSNDYYERMCKSYPIHPEVFDRLYEDWSTLQSFQRTRGVLQYMAIVIHHLWNSENRDALILPGSIDLGNGNVRNKSIQYLPQGWEPVIEKEVDGPRSVPIDIDGHDTRFGSIQAARRTMRTVFLGSAPSVTGQFIKGVEMERILLGTAQPGQTIGVFEDVLKRLHDRLTYLYSDAGRYWLDTRPNLRREMESRKQNINNREELEPLLKTSVTSIFGRNHSFGGIHVFTSSADVVDEFSSGPRLVVLPLECGYSRGDTAIAFQAAEKILRFRGDQPRQKQNRLIFLAPDFDVVSRLKDLGRTYLAWESIVKDAAEEKITLTIALAKQAKQNADAVKQSLQQTVREAYKWLLCPFEIFEKGKPILTWDTAAVSPAAPNVMTEIETKLRQEEWIISEWSPIHLRTMLQQWYLKDSKQEVSAAKVWQDSCNYLYLPRIVNEAVFKQTISNGLESTDFFGYASGKEGDRYLGFVFGDRSTVILDENSLIIDRDHAAEYQSKLTEVPNVGVAPDAPNSGSGVTGGSLPHVTGNPAPDQPAPPTTVKKQFYGTVSLEPLTAKIEFNDIVNEVVEQFTTKTGVKLKISVEIEATLDVGFDESTQRAVKENCNVLKFGTYEFEKG